MSSVSSTPRRVPVLRVLVMALLLANGCVQARDRLATAALETPPSGVVAPSPVTAMRIAQAVDFSM